MTLKDGLTNIVTEEMLLLTHSREDRLKLFFARRFMILKRRLPMKRG